MEWGGTDEVTGTLMNIFVPAMWENTIFPCFTVNNCYYHSIYFFQFIDVM